MAEELFIPKLGQTVEEVTLVDWKVADGVRVSYGDEVLEVETDKAIFPIEANADGYIHLGPYRSGDVLPVLTVVAIIGKQEEVFTTKPAGEQVQPVTVQEEGQAAGDVAAERQAEVHASPERQFASPRARKLASAKGVDLEGVVPTGGGGVRIVEQDVLNYLQTVPKATPLAKRMAAIEGVDLHQVAPSGAHGEIRRADVAAQLASNHTKPAAGDVLPLRGVRARIAERMAASAHTTARVTLFMDVDVTELVRLRSRLVEKVAVEWGFRPGYNDLLIKILAYALRKDPALNICLTEAGINMLNQVNIGVAVDTERGLLVPVICDAERKSLREIGVELRALTERARSGCSLPEDLTGGTFTITNLGMYEIDAFTPVINLPECAILGVGRITPQPVFVGENLVRRERLTLSLAFDHRLVDGAPAARFLQLVKSLVEEPALMGLEG